MMKRIFPAFAAVAVLLAGCAKEEPAPLTKEDIKLEYAVYHANLRMVRDALDRKADPNTSGRRGFPVLMEAAVLQHPEIMRTLIGRGADVNITDRNGDTPLHVAVASKKTDIVELLLQHHANPNCAGKFKRTPIMEATRLGMIDNVRLLLKHKADPSAKDLFERGILTYAAIAPVNGIELLKLFASPGQHVARPEELDLQASPLLAAMQQGRPETVEYILREIPTFAPDSWQPLGLAAMKLAIEFNKPGWVKILTEKGVNLNKNLPAAFKAVRFVNVEGVYKFLARNGALDRGYTPLIWAAVYKRPDIAAYLVSKGARTDVISNEGKDVYAYANDNATRRAIRKAEREAVQKNRNP